MQGPVQTNRPLSGLDRPLPEPSERKFIPHVSNGIPENKKCNLFTLQFFSAITYLLDQSSDRTLPSRTAHLLHSLLAASCLSGCFRKPLGVV